MRPASNCASFWWGWGMSEYFTPLIVGDNIAELSKSALPASAADDAGHYPFFCSSAEVKATATWLQDKPTVLMGTGGMASANYGEDRFAYSTDTWGFRSNTYKLSTKFLFRKIQQHLPRIDYAGFEGSGLRHLRKEFVKKLRIDVPSPTVQARIVEIVDCHDRAIEQTEALIAKYQQIKAGLMHDLFTRGVTADGKLRPLREQAPELYQETPIGWIPKEWEIMSLRGCLNGNPTNGIYKPPALIGHGILLVGQTAFTLGRSINFAFARRAVLSKDELSHYGLMENDILVTRVFATVEGVGQPTLVPAMHEPAVYESNMMRLRVERTIILPALLFEWLRSHPVRRMIVSGANASNQTSVNQQLLNILPVPRPVPEEQLRMIKIINAFDARIKSEKSTLAKFCQQKLGLMHDLLTGRVRVQV